MLHAGYRKQDEADWDSRYEDFWTTDGHGPSVHEAQPVAEAF